MTLNQGTIGSKYKIEDMTLPQNRYGFIASSGSAGGSDLSGYLNQMYDAQLKSQLAALESK